MPLAPLFVPTHAELRKKLRLSGLETGSDAEQILDEAIVSTRVAFIAALSQARITMILATTYTATPSTNDEFIRTLAAVTETKMVRLELLDTLPTAKMDASGNLLKRWNEEAPFREMSADDLEAMRSRLQSDIDNAMELLAGESADDASEGQVWDGSPVDDTPALGDSLCRTSQALLNLEYLG